MGRMVREEYHMISALQERPTIMVTKKVQASSISLISNVTETKIFRYIVACLASMNDFVISPIEPLST